MNERLCNENNNKGNPEMVYFNPEPVTFAFHLAKISGSNGNFPEQTDDLQRCSTFLEQKVQFRLHKISIHHM